MINVYERNDQQCCNQRVYKKALPRETKTGEDSNCKEARCKLYYRISQGDCSPTVATSSPEPEIAYNWNVIVEGNTGPAARTSGSRMYQGKRSGKTVNTHVQKTAHRHAEQKDENLKNQRIPPKCSRSINAHAGCFQSNGICCQAQNGQQSAEAVMSCADLSVSWQN